MSILTGVAWNLRIALDSVAMLIVLILPMQEHKASFHFFVSFQILEYR